MDNFIDTPDEIRPKNPWPRLLMLIGLILLCIFSIGICTVNFLKSGPEPAIQLEANQLEINITLLYFTCFGIHPLKNCLYCLYRFY